MLFSSFFLNVYWSIIYLSINYQLLFIWEHFFWSICITIYLSIYLSIYLYIYNVFLCKIYGLLGLVRVQNKQSNSFFGPNILVICLWPFSLHFFIHKFFVFFIFYGSHMKVFIDNVFSYFRNTIKYLLCVECFLHLNVHRFFTLKIFLGYKSKISYFMI